MSSDFESTSADDLELWDPHVEPAALKAMVARLQSAGIAVEEQRRIGALTTFGIGGPAGAFVVAADLAVLTRVLRAFESPADLVAVPLLVLGKGSNMLVADQGFPGVVVKLGPAFKYVRRDGDVVEAGGGEAMPALAAWTAREGLAGLEFAAGIPATVGGSVRMNAGAHGSTTSAALMSVDVAVPVSGEIVTLVAADLRFGYRSSVLPAGGVIVAARWQLSRDEPAAIRQRLDELRAWRRSTQPLRERNCGSVFTNPVDDSAGRLIEAAGLKGARRGGAQVSAKHANFITVSRDASADDVLRLIREVRAAVARSGGPLLVPEVRLVGRFSESSA